WVGLGLGRCGHGYCSLTPMMSVHPTLTHQVAFLPPRAPLSPDQAPAQDAASWAASARRPAAGWLMARSTSPPKWSTSDQAPLTPAACASSGDTVTRPATTRHGSPRSRAAAATPATTFP